MNESSAVRPTDKVRIGASGWSYRDWVGPFYPESTPPRDYLARYAEHFTTVEVDSTFYAIPSAATVSGWAQRTETGFRFALKVPSLVTHGARGERPAVDRVLAEDPHLELFLEVLEPLRPKVAVLLFQFPYFRVRSLEAADILSRLERTLRRLPREYRYAVELRNKNWITPDYLGLLSEHRVAAVLLDHPYMPPPRRQIDAGMVTTDFSYARLLGDRYAIEEKTKSWGKTVENKSAGIQRWADLVREVAGRPDLRQVYVFANNHYAGHAPATCRELARRVGLAST